MTACVRRATGARGAVPRWQGGKMPLSSELAHAALEQLRLATLDRYEGPEMQALQPLLAIVLPSWRPDWASRAVEILTPAFLAGSGL